MLTTTVLEQVLTSTANLTIGVVGDLFLDRYLDIDARFTEQSIETGLDAYQVTCVRPSPGAAGTVINNLAALGVKRLCPVSVVGDDGEGHELRQALSRLQAVDARGIVVWRDRAFHTPTYVKPMLHTSGGTSREMNRLDIKNRVPLPARAQELILEALDVAWPQVDAVLVLDQVSEAECGVVTRSLRQRLAERAQAQPDKLVLADSRERIGLFHSLWAKPNEAECRKAVAHAEQQDQSLESCVGALARRLGRPVFCTCGELGIMVIDPRSGTDRPSLVPAYPVRGPIDVVGAGDSSSAGIACALASGAGLEEAAAFGNLVASITVQQIGTTGTASAEQVRARWKSVSSGR